MQTSGEGIKQTYANIRGGGQADTCEHRGRGSSRYMRTSGEPVQADICEHKWRGSSRYMKTSGEGSQADTCKHRRRGVKQTNAKIGEEVKQTHANIEGGGQVGTCEHRGRGVKQTH